MTESATEEEADPAIIGRADRLRDAVKRSGGNAAVARKIGMSPATLNNYLAGRDMKVSALVALADACNVSIEWLAAGREAVMSQAQYLGSTLGFTDDHLSKPAHYWALLALTLSAQEFYEKADKHGTLSQVLAWVASNYQNALPLPDRRVKLVDRDPEEP